MIEPCGRNRLLSRLNSVYILVRNFSLPPFLPPALPSFLHPSLPPSFHPSLLAFLPFSFLPSPLSLSLSLSPLSTCIINYKMCIHIFYRLAVQNQAFKQQLQIQLVGRLMKNPLMPRKIPRFRLLQPRMTELMEVALNARSRSNFNQLC